MGNSLQPTPALKFQHVVIVGFSFAGFSIASLLWDHFKVTVIDRNEYFEYVPFNVKVPIDEDLPDKMLFSFDKMANAYNGKFTFKQATLLEVGLDNTIQVQIIQSGIQETVSYDFLVICTGSSYSNPAIKEHNVVTIQDRKAGQQEIARKVESSNSILIAGAGIVGVEIAGELAVKYGESKSKKIAICLRGERLLPHLPAKAGALAETFLKQHNVEILYKTPYGETMAKESSFDFHINCTGIGIHKTDYLRKNFSQCLGKDGKIFVNDLLQISAVDPRINPLAPGVRENIFAFGDVCQTSLNEAKTILNIKLLVDYLHKNILEIALGRRPSHQLPGNIVNVAIISLGPKYGIFVMNDFVEAKEFYGVRKFEFFEANTKLSSGDLAELAKSTKQINGLKRFIACCNVCCCCTACSSLHTPHSKAKARLN